MDKRPLNAVIIAALMLSSGVVSSATPPSENETAVILDQEDYWEYMIEHANQDYHDTEKMTTTTIIQNNTDEGVYDIGRDTHRVIKEDPVTTTTFPETLGRVEWLEAKKEAVRREAESQGITYTTTTLEAPQCGRSKSVCSVEFDADQDGRNDCCKEETNPACAECLSYCMDECNRLYVGVKTCFRDDRAGPVCICSETMPNCYTIPEPPVTTTTLSVEAGGGSKLMYFFTLAMIILALYGGMRFMSRMR
ncbi:MAG: hypothetical protein GF416_02885 [Candidatus Altiarchaeales archaeon]|nr:hypothetical protein [Candidatus Altiarchaeales archaeon]MBD3416065.1 hypothetical protein [Candidatus Altiarchaeales archaeon]